MTNEERDIIRCAVRLCSLWRTSDEAQSAGLAGKNEAPSKTAPPTSWLTAARKNLRAAVDAHQTSTQAES